MDRPSPLAALLAPLARRPGWAAALCGAVGACGFQPLSLWPLALLAVGGLVALVARAAGWKQAFLLGWLFGVGHFTVGNNWIATAFTYQSNMPAWLGWIAVVALSLYLAVYPALATLAAWLLARGRLAALVPAFAATWIVSEWLRGWVFTGFAWNPLGAVLLGGFDAPGLAALLPWTGTYALSGLAALLAGLLVLALRAVGHDRRARLGAAVGVVALALAMHAPTEPSAPNPAGLRYTLVQPNIHQDDLNDPTKWDAQFARAAALSRDLQPGEPRLVLWPESGVPDYLRDGYPPYYYADTTWGGDPALARARLGRAAGPGSLLLTGAVDLEVERGRIVAARNVVTAVDEGGAIRGGYAKAHLVPYGEYLPMRSLLEPLGLSRLVPGSLDFWPGPGPRSLDLGRWGRVGVQICYEIVFSGQVVGPGPRPDFLFNPSNDGWFGSWGPPQHLAQARMRAIEEGLPVLRATTNGISAVIDARGVVAGHAPRHVAQRIDGRVPEALAPTLFARAGNLLPLGWAMVFLAVALVALRRRGR